MLKIIFFDIDGTLLEMGKTSMLPSTLNALEELKQSARSTGSFDYSRERVQTSPIGDKLCSDVSRYVDLDNQINAEIDRFVDAKEQIIREIRGLRDVNYIKVLYKVYVQFKSVKVAAQEIGKSYHYTSELHKKALNAFEEQYENLYYLI